MRGSQASFFLFSPGGTPNSHPVGGSAGAEPPRRLDEALKFLEAGIERRARLAGRDSDMLSDLDGQIDVAGYDSPGPTEGRNAALTGGTDSGEQLLGN